MPAEWAAQAAVLIAWPPSGGDWEPYLERVEPAFRALAKAISRHARLLVVTDDAAEALSQLAVAGVPAGGATIVQQPLDDTWTRDYGPITVLDGGRPLLLDFTFNGWGLKYPASQDNQATRRLHAAGHFATTPLRTIGLALEGGAIESDGAGTILTTTACLLSPNRNPHLSREQIESALREHLGATHVLWLDHGHLDGDDTDSHIDTIARLCPDNTIAYVRCDDPEDDHFLDFQKLELELFALRNREGKPFRLVPLPWCATMLAPDDGRRLPATYANVLFLNGSVLVPTYGEARRDQAALTAWGNACPGFRIESVACGDLALQHGSLHCATMQIPEEVYP